MNWLSKWQKKFQDNPHNPLEQADQALTRKDYSRAEQLLVPYLSLHPTQAEAYALYGRVLMYQQLWVEATEVFWKVTEINPRQPYIWALLGYVTLQSGQLKDALTTLQFARAQDPDNEAILECLLILAQRIDSQELKQSVEKDLDRLKPPVRQQIAVTKEAEVRELA